MEQGITAEKIKESLNNFQVDKLPNNYFKISIINSTIEKILKSFNIDFDFTDYSMNGIKELRKLINHVTI